MTDKIQTRKQTDRLYRKKNPTETDRSEKRLERNLRSNNNILGALFKYRFIFRKEHFIRFSELFVTKSKS